jgi:5-methylcytosine-specific restriction endonuclease McrA
MRAHTTSAPERAVARHALVLNTTYEPLCVVSQRRAVVLVLTDKAVLVEPSGDILHSARTAIDAPCVLRLTRYVRVPYRGAVPLTRRAVFARDGGRCAYCNAPATSVDHVVPRSRGGEHVWENVVSACRHCNHIKADREVDDLGWRMRVVPRQPSGPSWRILATGRRDPRWAPYLADIAG